MGTERLQELIQNRFQYFKDYRDSCQFYNTCVPDSFLAALHTTALKYPNIEALLNSDDFLREVMSLVNEEMCKEARERFVKELNPGGNDLHSNVKDYFPLIAQLVRAKIPFKEKPPSDCAIPSALTKCGDVIVLGDLSSTALILVHRDVFDDLYQDFKITELPPHADDQNKRIFALQFLLIGKERHMNMCFQSYGNKWHLYDNDPKQETIQTFDMQKLENYDMCLAGYVGEPQQQECKLGISETGDTAGTRPFYSTASSSSYAYRTQSVEDMEVEDMEVKDLSCSQFCPIAIPETSALGSKPIHQNDPEFSSKFSNQVHKGEDIEMLSCSNSDSD